MTNREKIDRIYESAQKIDQVYDVWATKHKLTLYEMMMFYEIFQKENREITQKELSMKLGAPKTSVNSLIKKQLNAGYIWMQVNPQNKREKIISLTESGERFARNLVQPLFQYEEEVIGMLDVRDVEIVITVQNKFADILLSKMEDI